ncbi:MAG: helix-turn-helix domain-containing protein [Bdellovibrionales bacterium]|nr:helix-turn-helix domain-containing protein [Bdellovibrionales bacterium]
MTDEVLTLDELSDYLKLSKSTTYKLVQEGVIPGQKVGKHWRFLKSVVDEYLKGSLKKGKAR